MFGFYLTSGALNKSLAEFRQDAGIKSNPKKLAAQGELPEGQERVAWAMYVSFFSSQTGKCRSVKPMCRGHICSVGPTCYRWGNLPARRVHAPGCKLGKMLAFYRNSFRSFSTGRPAWCPSIQCPWPSARHGCGRLPPSSWRRERPDGRRSFAPPSRPGSLPSGCTADPARR